MPEIPQFIGDFSKEFSQNERSTTADQIKKTRSEYFLNLIRENGRKQRIEELGQEISENEIEITSIINETKEIEQELEEKRSRVFGKLLEKLGDASLSEMLDIKDYDRDAKEQDLASLREELRQLENTEVDLDGLKNAKKMLNNFYAGQTEKWKEFDQESSAREVDVAMEKHDCLFVHAIGYKKIIPGNSPLAGGTDFQTQLEIIMALKPDISVSSIKKGDSCKNIAWHDMGVILRGGKILSASASDAGTVATSLRKEGLGSEEAGWAQPKPIEDKIESAITGRREDTYNEFVVSKPEVAGIFVLQDRYYNPSYERKNPIEYANEIRPFLKKYGVPLFILENGETTKISIDPTTLAIGREKISTPVQILEDNLVNIPEEQREEILADLVEKQPFLSSAFNVEGKYFDSMGDGKKAYQYCILQDNRTPNDTAVEQKPFTDQTLSRLKQYDLCPKEDIKSIAILSEIKQIDTRSLFVRLNDQNYITSCGERRSIQADPCPSINRLFSDQPPSVVIGGRYTSEHPNDPSDYIKSCLRILSEYQEDIQLSHEDKLKKKWGDKNWFYYHYPVEEYEFEKRYNTSGITCIAYNLYGFGEEAARFGDEQIAEKAFQLASQIIPLDEIKALKTKRSREDGGFKIYKEDLFLKKKTEKVS